MPHPQDEDNFKLEEKEFNFGFWKCCKPCGTCCTGFWCPCILVNKTSDLIGFLQEHKENPNNELYRKSPSGCGWTGCGFCVLTMCGGWGSIITCFQRGEIRTNNKMKDGNKCTDFVRNFCCPCCSIIQQHKEVEARWKVVTNAYQPQQPMNAK